MKWNNFKNDTLYQITHEETKSEQSYVNKNWISNLKKSFQIQMASLVKVPTVKEETIPIL